MSDELDPRAPHEGDEFDFPEDPLLEASLRNLATISAPPSFLSSVMFRVYEKHAREHLKLRHVAGFVLLFLAGSLGFFALDVAQFQQRQALPHFAQALQQRLAVLNDLLQNFVTHSLDLFSASWQVIHSMVRAYLTQTPLPIQAVIFVAIFSFLWLARRWLRR